MLPMHKISLLQFMFFIIIYLREVSSSNIPAALWNIKGNILHVKPVPALSHHDEIFTDSLNNVLLQGGNILVFAVNKLSLEDFSAGDKPSVLNNTLQNLEAFLELQPHMLLPSIQEPLNQIHKIHCGVQEIVMDQALDNSVLELVTSAFDKSCVVVLHISDYGFAVQTEEINAFLPSLKKAKKNVVGIFTAMKSSWGVDDDDHHIFRNLLATADADPNFINYTGCIYMYAENASLGIGKEDNGTVMLSFPPDLDGSACNENSTVLQLNFKASSVASAVTIRFEFKKAYGSWSTKGTVSVTGEKVPEGEFRLDGNIEAPIGFSYSCGKLSLNAQNVSDPITFTFDGFQIQPFEVKEKFSDSFDCVPFFTIPIWMGIFVSLLFIVIINIGVYALFSVHTMDRFDDPKGKTISVATAD